jgi:hypothetical protein
MIDKGKVVTDTSGYRVFFLNGLTVMKIRSGVAIALASALVALLASAAAIADTIPLYNTGVDNNGALLSAGTLDPHYTLVGASPVGPSAFVVIPGQFPIIPGLWFADGPSSMWIGPFANENAFPPPGYPGVFDYRTTFNLTGFNLSTVTISGGWSTDNNGVDILINGVSMGLTTPSNQFSSGLAAFAISSNFIGGVNTLDFLVGNDADIATGLRVELSGSGDLLAAPLPAALPLFAAGLGVIGLIGWRRARKAQSIAT